MTSVDNSSSRTRLSRVVVFLFAVTAGSSAGCLYYLQPLLHEISVDFGVSTTTAGLLISTTQIGYLLGLAFVVPLGDFVNRRRLVTGLLVVSGIALVAAGAMPTYAGLLIMIFAVGVSVSAAQIVVPWAASIAGPGERGAVVGHVMSGLLVGILASRVVSGLVAQVGGWRVVLVVAAVVQLVMAALVFMRAPAAQSGTAGSGQSYGQVLSSIVTLIRTQNVLRHRMILGGLNMAGFSAMWTAIAFLLAGSGDSDYQYSEAAIGLFGLAGIAGALGAPLVGRFADRGLVRHMQYGVWGTQILGWLLLWVGGHHVAVLVIALLVFDFGVQGAQLANQTGVYSLDDQARSRLTTAYMVAYFAGGVVGSSMGGWAYQTGGWTLVCIIGGAFGVAGLALWAGFAVAERDHPIQGKHAQARLRAGTTD
ncbi:MFS transporter [Gordonia sp. CPCC 206044]|uniref:MFS transporter n=1 Tax=Gordonia sp. CPCC 206044 TaxID=3140793 RepID=UPI003AF3E22E